MKNIFVFFTVIIMIFSCNTEINNNLEDSRAPGFVRDAEGNQTNAYDANPSNLDLWDEYINAHNDRDFESIINMNADSTKQFGSFKIYAPNGTVLNGTDEQIDFLKGWFENENPKWNTYLSYTNRVEGQPGEWVITGSQVKRNVGGEEVVTWDIADVYIEDGKIGAFWVWTRADAVQD